MAGQKQLVSKEVDKRVDITLDKTIKRVNEGSVNGLVKFGENNDYPQLMEKLIYGSVTAKASANIYAKFLIGQGFENEQINDIKIGLDSRGKQITVKSLLSQVAISVSKNNGFYIHCNLTLDRKIKNVHLKAFKNCRFAKPDDTGYSSQIAYYDNWEKEIKETGAKYDKRKIKFFNVFNLDEKVFNSQIQNVKGIENYKGQIYFQFFDDEYFYPLSNYDEVYLDCDTEAQIALYKNRELRNGFFKKTVLRIQESLGDGYKESLAESARQSLGAGGDGLWIIEDQLNEDNEPGSESAFKIDQIDSNIDDELFDNWEKGLANNIRKAAKGVPATLLDVEESKLGTTSGEAYAQAVNVFNTITNDDRDLISKSFKEMFSNFDNEVLRNNTNWKIKPLNLKEQEQDGTNNINTAESN